MEDIEREPLLERNTVPASQRFKEAVGRFPVLKMIGGMALAFISKSIFIGNNSAIEMLRLQSTDVLLVRSIVQIVIFGLILKIRNQNLWIWAVDEGRNIHVVRSQMFAQALFAGLTLLGSYIAVLCMPLGDAITMVFSAPIFTMALSRICFGERLRLYKLSCGIVLIVGVILISTPTFLFGQAYYYSSNGSGQHSYYSFGATMAIVSAISGASYLVLLKYLYRNQTTNSAVLVAFYSGFGCLIVSVFTALTFYEYRTKQQVLSAAIVNIPASTWIAMMCISVLGLLGFITCNVAIKLITPVLVSFVASLEILIAFGAQVALMHEIPDTLDYIGSALVAFSVAAISLEDAFLNSVPPCVKKVF